MALVLCLCSIISTSKTYAFPMVPSGSSALPSLNQRDLRRSWVIGPSGRGTLDIVYSCSTTLFLCAYTAFHPNTPLHDGHYSFLMRLGLMVFTIVFPECTLYLALRQLWTANSLRKRVNNAYQVVIKEPHPGPQVMVSLSFIDLEYDSDGHYRRRSHFSQNGEFKVAIYCLGAHAAIIRISGTWSKHSLQHAGAWLSIHPNFGTRTGFSSRGLEFPSWLNVAYFPKYLSTRCMPGATQTLSQRH